MLTIEPKMVNVFRVCSPIFSKCMYFGGCSYIQTPHDWLKISSSPKYSYYDWVDHRWYGALTCPWDR